MKSAVNGTVSPLQTAARDLGVIVRCHQLVCAIPVRWVSRLVLPEEITLIGTSVVDSGSGRHAAWNLGERLGLPPVKDAWVLLSIPHASAQIPIALATGTCLVVQPLPEHVVLPQGLFKERRGAIAGVFVPEASHAAACGVELDIPLLWSASELDASAALVRRQRAR